MKYLITTEQVKLGMDNLLKRMNIQVDISYVRDNGRDSIDAKVYLYKDGQIFGSANGYNFYFHYDNRFNELKPEENNPYIINLGLFKFLPNEVITQYFNDRVKDYLAGYIDRGYSRLRRP